MQVGWVGDSCKIAWVRQCHQQSEAEVLDGAQHGHVHADAAPRLAQRRRVVNRCAHLIRCGSSNTQQVGEGGDLSKSGEGAICKANLLLSWLLRRYDRFHHSCAEQQCETNNECDGFTGRMVLDCHDSDSCPVRKSVSAISEIEADQSEFEEDAMQLELGATSHA